MAEHPYSSLPDHRFWRKAVTQTPPFALDPLLSTPFKIARSDKVATGGSCFAQEIAQNLQASGFHYFLAETPPEGMSAEEARRRNYAMYSCRYGNLYTTTALLQLFDRAYGAFAPELAHWSREEDGRIVDPFRPAIEPDGYATIDDMLADRERHFSAVRDMFETLDVFVFTFGHTESWRCRADGAVLQQAPGVAGGVWDPALYAFHNMTVSQVVRDFLAAVDRIRSVNAKARIIVTVSPVNIIATYENRHVLEANSAIKAILRAAADEVVRARPDIAYFPSYDLVTVAPNAARFYRDDMRRVSPLGVSFLMRLFFAHFTEAEAEPAGARPLRIAVSAEAESHSRIVCDEEAIETA